MEVPNEMKARYIERRKRDFENCMSSLGQRKYEEIEKVGHQLKGNGVTFGHPELSLIGEKLEDAASQKDILQLEQVLKEFSAWVKASY